MVEKKEVPIWAWVVIIILAILLSHYYTQSSKNLNFYYESVLENADSIVLYAESVEDYLQLLICYRENLPTCDFLNEKYPEADVKIEKNR